jgi:hypothetical protein
MRACALSLLLLLAVGVPFVVAARRVVSPAAERETGPPWPVIYRRDLGNGEFLEVVDKPVSEECHLQPATDYAGAAVRWGHRPAPPVTSAAQCCNMCQEWNMHPRNARYRPCHAWVFCEDPSGVCWSKDTWNHTTGER